MKKEAEINSWAMALYRALKENPGKSEEIFANLKKSLAKKQEFLETVVKKAGKIYDREQRADLFSAKQMDDREKNEIKAKIKGILGTEKDISYSLDESLLAGFRLKTKDILIKASLKDILSGLKNKLYGHNRTI
ncbi:MAG: F0F1 ATP synthase subunit delta [Candidatus Pacebacteria bacterium]|nr:F0F1 ATP synthase subunit delta [Candidatus Paceibacterota bacterium]